MNNWPYMAGGWLLWQFMKPKITTGLPKPGKEGGDEGPSTGTPGMDQFG